MSQAALPRAGHASVCARTPATSPAEEQSKAIAAGTGLAKQTASAKTMAESSVWKAEVTCVPREAGPPSTQQDAAKKPAQHHTSCTWTRTQIAQPALAGMSRPASK